MCNVATHVDISLNPHIKNAPPVTINLSPIRYLSPQSFIRVYRVFHKLTEPSNLFLTVTCYVFVRFVKVSANLWRRYIYNDFLIGLGLAETRITHDNVIKWKHFPRYWPFVRGIHRSPVNPPRKGQWCGPLMLSLIYAWINWWFESHRAHNDVTVMQIVQDRIYPTSLGVMLLTETTSTSIRLNTWVSNNIMLSSAGRNYSFTH